MIKLIQSKNFIKAYKKFVKKNPKRAEALIKTLSYFRHNPNYPSLHTEKIKNTQVWTIRIDLSNRIFFIWLSKNSVLLIDVGPLDKYKKY